MMITILMIFPLTGSSIFIIRNGTSHLLSGGYLQVSDTGQSLDPVPPSIDDITFDLLVNDDDKVSARAPYIHYHINHHY